MSQTVPRSTTSAEELRDRIRAHYIRAPKVQRGGWLANEDLFPGAVVLTEVPAPGDSRRRIDALAIGLTQARAGLDGFEIKVSRSDWLRELDQPHKADAWFPYTHRWWVVAPSTEIVKPNELPDGWGLMIPAPRTARRLNVVVTPATRTPAVDWPLFLEITKKFDRYRKAAVSVAVDAVRDKMTAEAREREARTAELFPSSESDETVIGKALVTATGIPSWQLRGLLERLGPWPQEALTAVLRTAIGLQPSPGTHRLAQEARTLTSVYQSTARALVNTPDLIEPGPHAGDTPKDA